MNEWDTVKYWLGYTPPPPEPDDGYRPWQPLDARILHRATEEEWHTEDCMNIPGAFMRSSPVMCVSTSYPLKYATMT